jgi:hypothetical protein
MILRNIKISDFPAYEEENSMICISIHKPSVVFHEINCLNLGPETGYSDPVFSLFSSVPPGKYQDSTLN